jgi:hypothetical protein
VNKFGEIGFLYNLLLSCLSGFFSLMCTCARTSHKVAPRLGCSLTRESVAFFKSTHLKRFHCSDVYSDGHLDNDQVFTAHDPNPRRIP